MLTALQRSTVGGAPMQINSPPASYLTPSLPPSKTFSNNFSSTHQEFHLILLPTSITYLLPVILCCFNLHIHPVSLICVLSFSSPPVCIYSIKLQIFTSFFFPLSFFFLVKFILQTFLFLFSPSIFLFSTWGAKVKHCILN